MLDVTEKRSQTKKRFVKLGFTAEETEKVVDKLNRLLSTYAVHYQKLRNFHWNIQGDAFFELHEKFEEQYNYTKKNIDIIAERIRVYGKTPISTLQGFLDNSDIEEAATDLNSGEMVSELIADFDVLLSIMTDVFHAAAEMGDVGTNRMTEKMMERLEKDYWMYSAFNK